MRNLVIEAAVESAAAALAAAEGSAHRIELCTNLAQGGVTPAMSLLRECLAKLTIPVFVLVRPRAGDFVYSAAEHGSMLEQIAQARAAGAHGIVTGALTARRVIDNVRLAELIAAARPLPVTFHRAFDECRDLPEALECLIRLGAERVLTSGGAATAVHGAETLARLVRQAQGRIGILAGGGITAANVVRIRDTGVHEVHFSVNDATKVRQVIETLRGER